MVLTLKKPLRFLIALALSTYIFIFFYFPSSIPATTRPWAPSLRMPAAEYGFDQLKYIDPLIGTINGGETDTWYHIH